LGLELRNSVSQVQWSNARDQKKREKSAPITPEFSNPNKSRKVRPWKKGGVRRKS